MENLQLLLPEIFLSLSIMFLLILGVFKKNSSKLIQNLSMITLIISAVVTFNETIGISNTKLFNDSIIIDYFSSLMKIITLLAAFLVLIISSNYLKTFQIFKIEYFWSLTSPLLYKKANKGISITKKVVSFENFVDVEQLRIKKIYFVRFVSQCFNSF